MQTPEPGYCDANPNRWFPAFYSIVSAVDRDLLNSAVGSTCLLHVEGFGWRVGVIWLPWHDYSSRTAAFQLARDLLVGLCQPSLPLVRGWLFL